MAEKKTLLALYRAEHHALHMYLLGLFRDQEHRAPTVPEYQELVETHDAVAEEISSLSDNNEGLTFEEQEALMLSGYLAGAMRRVIGDGPCAQGDWREVCTDIHNIQARILSQVAARAGLCRPLGGTIDG